MALFSTQKAVAQGVEDENVEGQRAALDNFERLLKDEEEALKDDQNILKNSLEKLEGTSGKLQPEEGEEDVDQDTKLDVSGDTMAYSEDKNHSVGT